MVGVGASDLDLGNANIDVMDDLLLELRWDIDDDFEDVDL